MRYAVNYYGEMPDAINAGDETDRMLLRWELEQSPPRGPRATEYRRRNHRHRRPCWSKCRRTSRASRRTDPAEAAAWRPALRNRLLPMLERGDLIIDFDRRLGGYIVARGPS